MAAGINSKYGEGDTLEVVNPQSEYFGMRGTVVRIGQAGWRISYYLQIPDMVTPRDIGESEVILVEKHDPVMSPQVAKEPVRVEAPSDDTPRVIIPAPEVPANSDVDTNPDAISTTTTTTTTNAPKRRGRPKGSKNRPKPSTTAPQSVTTKRK